MSEDGKKPKLLSGGNPQIAKGIGNAPVTPPPPVASKHARVRYAHIGEGDSFEDQFGLWIDQAIKLPGERI